MFERLLIIYVAARCSRHLLCVVESMVLTDVCEHGCDAKKVRSDSSFTIITWCGVRNADVMSCVADAAARAAIALIAAVEEV